MATHRLDQMLTLWHPANRNIVIVAMWTDPAREWRAGDLQPLTNLSHEQVYTALQGNPEWFKRLSGGKYVMRDRARAVVEAIKLSDLACVRPPPKVKPKRTRHRCSIRRMA